jgi:hypothetical protein
MEKVFYKTCTISNLIKLQDSQETMKVASSLSRISTCRIAGKTGTETRFFPTKPVRQVKIY